ncbi:MAG: serine/threonine-protein kinase [Phycisphaerales bacterium]
MIRRDDQPLTSCPSEDELELASLASCPWHIREHITACPRCQQRLDRIRADEELIREIAGAVPAKRANRSASGFEGYDDLTEIHRGGQGVVYRATQRDTNRVVALKTLRSGHFASREERARFQREIELVARLRHPGIVTVFGSGTTDSGERFITMEYVEGDRLDRWAHIKWDKPPAWTAATLREFATLFADLCDAAAHAQQRGVIHRDLKPSNVLVDETGAPRVLDFGIARESDDEETARLTQGHEFVGTYAYAAPEQFKGGGDALGTWTDVYAIGVMAYEVLTGERPHAWTGSLPELTRAVCETEPEDPIKRNPTVSKDIATIVLRALAIDPERRYQSAAQLRNEFERVANGEPIEARRDNTVYVLRRMASKYRWRVAAGALAIVLVLIAAPITAYFAYESSQNAKEAIANAQDANNKAVRLESLIRTAFGSLQSLDETSGDPEDPNAQPIQNLEQFLIVLTDAARAELSLYPELLVPIESRLSLAWLQRAKPDYKRAINHGRAAIDLYLLDPNAERSVLATLHHNMGRIYWNAAQYENAREHYSTALEMRRNLFGTDNPQTAETSQHLASTLTILNDYAQAETLLRSALASFIASFDDQHPSVAQVWFALGRCLHEQGETEESVECLEHALTLIESQVGPDDWRVGNALHGLAAALIDAGDLDRARELADRALINKERSRGVGHRDYAATRLLLARIDLRENPADPMSAERIARESLASLQASYATDQPETATALSYLGHALYTQNRFDEAREALEAALTMRKNVLPTGSWYIGESHLMLARCDDQLGDTHSALAHFAAAAEILNATRREDDPLRNSAKARLQGLTSRQAP